MTAEPGKATAHILYMDVIRSELLPMERQRAVYEELNGLVQQTAEYRRATTAARVLCRPSGDGMALVFFESMEASLCCALELAELLKERPHLALRMGIHSGEVYRVKDINGSDDVTGDGIVTAKRVMDCGDAGHILVSSTVGEALDRQPQWAGMLHFIGTCQVKHGKRLALWSLYTPEVGNRRPPQVLVDQVGAETMAAHAQDYRRQDVMVKAIAGLVLLVIPAAVFTNLLSPFAMAVVPMAMGVLFLTYRGRK